MSPARFRSYGWNVLRVGDANDLERIEDALAVFGQDQAAPDADHPGQPYRLRIAHTGRIPPPPTASRWAKDEVRLAKRAYGWPEDAQFLVPDGVMAHFAAGDRTRAAPRRTA